MNNLFGFGHSSSSLCSSLCHFSSYWNPYQPLGTSILVWVNQSVLQLRYTPHIQMPCDRPFYFRRSTTYENSKYGALIQAACGVVVAIIAWGMSLYFQYHILNVFDPLNRCTDKDWIGREICG